MLSRFCLHLPAQRHLSSSHMMGGESYCQFWCHMMLSRQERLLSRLAMCLSLDQSSQLRHGDFWRISIQSCGRPCGQPRMGVGAKVSTQSSRAEGVTMERGKGDSLKERLLSNGPYSLHWAFLTSSLEDSPLSLHHMPRLSCFPKHFCPLGPLRLPLPALLHSRAESSPEVGCVNLFSLFREQLGTVH